jgi:hypothetical protein
MGQKSGDQTTTNTTSTPPKYLLPYLKDAVGKAQTVSNQPYTQYQGQRLGDFSPDTQTAFGDIRAQAAGGGGTPAVNTGIAAATTAAGYQPQDITSTNLQPYMSPYTSNVLDVQKQRATQAFQEQQAGRDASAVQAGAFGGDRRFVADSLAQRDLNQQLQGIDATGLEAAFNNATGLFQQGQTNKLNAANLGLNAASTLGALGQTKNDLGLNNAEALSSVGSKIQQQQQAGLDLAQQDFTNQRDWPAKQLQLYSQLLQGQPVTPSTSTVTTAPAPDFLSQLAGLATGGAGLWKLLSGA